MQLSKMKLQITSVHLLNFCIAVAMSFTAMCTTLILILLLSYWTSGGTLLLSMFITGILGMLYNVQDKLLYHPDQPSHSRLFVDSPSMLGLPYENIFISTQDGCKINLLLVKRPALAFHSAPTVIFFHGNAGNIGHRLLNAYALHSFCGANVLLVEYRGYGKSTGTPSETGLYLDAQAAVDYLLARTDVDHSKIVVFGRSLGGAIAIFIASQPRYTTRIMSLVLENTFTSLPEIGRVIFDLRILSYLPDWCFKNQFPSNTKVRNIRVPTLFISGLADNLIPPSMMLHLYRVCGSPLKRLAQIEGGTHNETWQSPGYVETINRFLSELAHVHSNSCRNSSAAVYSPAPFEDGGVDLV